MIESLIFCLLLNFQWFVMRGDDALGEPHAADEKSEADHSLRGGLCFVALR
jgi:hypothetical protein